MKNPLLAICAILTILLIPVIVLASNGGDTGSIAGRWNTEARIFNVKGKPLIYDTTHRSNISVVLQRWTLESGAKAQAEINSMKGEN